MYQSGLVQLVHFVQRIAGPHFDPPRAAAVGYKPVALSITVVTRRDWSRPGRLEG